MNASIILAMISILPALITVFFTIVSTLYSSSVNQQSKHIKFSDYRVFDITHLERFRLKNVDLIKAKGSTKRHIMINVALASIVIISTMLAIYFLNFLGDPGGPLYNILRIQDSQETLYIQIATIIYIILAFISLCILYPFFRWNMEKLNLIKMEIEPNELEKQSKSEVQSKHRIQPILLFDRAKIEFNLDHQLVKENTLSALKLMEAKVIELKPYLHTSPSRIDLEAYIGSKPPFDKHLSISIMPQENKCSLEVSFHTYQHDSLHIHFLFPIKYYYWDHQKEAAKMMNYFITLAVLDLNKTAEANSSKNHPSKQKLLFVQ